MFTSGTTGYPKGAATTHGQTLRTFGTWAAIVGLAAGDRYLVVNPFFHTFGYKAGILACLMAGATMVPEPVFDAATVMERIPAERITVLPGPPTILPVVVGRSSSARSSTSRRCGWGSPGRRWCRSSWCTPCGTELGFATVLTAYGLTESCGTVTMCRRSDPAEVIAGTSGRAIPGLEVDVVADGSSVGVGEPGEIVVRGYNVMSRLLGRRRGHRGRHRCRRVAAHRRHRGHGRRRATSPSPTG